MDRGSCDPLADRVLRRKFPCYSGMQVQAFCSRVFRSSCIFKPKTIIQTISTATATNNIPLIAMSTQSSSSNLRRPLFLQCSDCNVPTWSFRGLPSSGPVGADVHIELCALHRANFNAPPPNQSVAAPVAPFPGSTHPSSSANPGPPSTPAAIASHPTHLLEDSPGLHTSPETSPCTTR